MTGMPAWLSAVVLAAAMSAALALGWWIGHRRPRRDEAVRGRLGDAVLALLGLLLAFTFSLALSQYNARRERAVDESNAIGDFYSCVSLLDEPARGQLQDLVRRYLEHHMTIAGARVEGAAMDRELQVASAIQGEMRQRVREAVIRRPPVTNPLVNTLNAVISRGAARLAAFRYRLPWSIVALLAMASVLSTLIVGMQEGAEGKLVLVPTAAFIVLVSMVIWVTLDLNQPAGGYITVSQEPFERLLSTMPQPR
jgi:hypothetical protein